MDDLSRLESVAAQLVGRVHDDDPVRVWAWLAAELPDWRDWYRLCFVLAAAVPTDQPWHDLVAWCERLPDPVENPVQDGGEPGPGSTTREPIAAQVNGR